MTPDVRLCVTLHFPTRDVTFHRFAPVNGVTPEWKAKETKAARRFFGSMGERLISVEYYVYTVEEEAP